MGHVRALNSKVKISLTGSPHFIVAKWGPLQCSHSVQLTVS